MLNYFLIAYSIDDISAESLLTCSSGILSCFLDFSLAIQVVASDLNILFCNCSGLVIIIFFILWSLLAMAVVLSKLKVQGVALA